MTELPYCLHYEGNKISTAKAKSQNVKEIPLNNVYYYLSQHHSQIYANQSRLMMKPKSTA